MGRDEIFITSKQGYLDFNYQEKAHRNLVIQELISSTSLQESDFVQESGYSMEPQFLNYSLQTSLKKLNLKTLDCVFL